MLSLVVILLPAGLIMVMPGVIMLLCCPRCIDVQVVLTPVEPNAELRGGAIGNLPAKSLP